MLRIQRLTRNGSASVVTIPAPMMRELGWHRGDLLAVRLARGGVTLARVDETKLADVMRSGGAAAPRGTR